MGLESLDILQDRSAPLEAVIGVLGAPERTDPGKQGRTYWEVRGKDFIVQFEAFPANDTETRISIRTALCCSIDCVTLMLAAAKSISMVAGNETWRVFNEPVHFRVSDEDAVVKLKQVFARRQRALFDCFSVDDLPPKALRPDSECVRYVSSSRI